MQDQVETTKSQGASAEKARIRQHQDLIRVEVVEERLSDGSKVWNVQIGDSGEHYEIYCRNQIAAINLKGKIDDAILEAV